MATIPSGKIIAPIIAGIILALAILILVPANITPQRIHDENYNGWKGTDQLLETFTAYKYLGITGNLSGKPIIHMDLYWPLASCDNGFKCLLGENIVVIIGRVENITEIAVHKNYTVTLKYRVEVTRIIYKPTVDIPSYEGRMCDYIEYANGTLICDTQVAIQEKKTIKQLIDNITIGKEITLKMPAWLTKDAITSNNTKDVNICDVGSPFPLLDPGNTYVLFIRVDKNGYSILYDFVYGPYAYMVVDGRVYSLDYVDYPVKMDPEKFFNADGVYWYPDNYEELRKMALERYSAHGIPLQDFIHMITG